MKWKNHGYGILSRFFYGYSATIAPLGAFISFETPTDLTMFNLFVYPIIGGYIAIFPKLVKTFAEASGENGNEV